MTNTGRQTRQKLREPLQRAQWLYLLLFFFPIYKAFKYTEHLENNIKHLNTPSILKTTLKAAILF